MIISRECSTNVIIESYFAWMITDMICMNWDNKKNVPPLSRVWHELENGSGADAAVDHSIKPAAASRPRKRLGGGVRFWISRHLSRISTWIKKGERGEDKGRVTDRFTLKYDTSNVWLIDCLLMNVSCWNFDLIKPESQAFVNSVNLPKPKWKNTKLFCVSLKSQD